MSIITKEKKPHNYNITNSVVVISESGITYLSGSAYSNKKNLDILQLKIHFSEYFIKRENTLTFIWNPRKSLNYFFEVYTNFKPLIL